MISFSISAHGPECIDDIQPLWEMLNHHHADISPHFEDHFTHASFVDRKAYLLGKAENSILRIFIAEAEDQMVGYLIASLGPNSEGEIESLFVREEYRGMKMGNALMCAALAWLEENNADPIGISVVFGNESAHPFYARYGFLPRSYRLIRA